MNHNNLIKEKIKSVYKSVEHGGFDIALNWKSELSYPYYKGFASDDIFIKKGSIFSFLGMVYNHFYRSSLAFGPEKNDINDEEKIHDISIYLKNFIENFEDLRRDFPKTVFFVVKYLYLIDEEKKFEDRFENALYPESYNVLREKFFETIDLSRYKYYDEIKEELGFSHNYF